MMQSTPTVALGPILLVLAAPVLHAEPEETRSLGAHVHGSASLDIAWDGNAVHIGLESPAADLVGFEHPPETDADRAALEGAVLRLKDGDRLFRFSPEAACKLVEVAVESPLLAPPGGHGQDEHAGHDGPEGNEAEHGHEHHANLEVAYRFVCAQPAKLERVRVGLFEAFPATETLRVQYVGTGGQSAAELRAASPDFELR
jgi:hypothetical protein